MKLGRTHRPGLLEAPDLAEQGGSHVEHLSGTYHTPVAAAYPPGGATSSRTLTWTADGPWASSAAYHVDIATDSGFSSILVTSGDVTASAITSWTIPATTTLTDGTTYYWRVKAKSAAGVWTPFSTTATLIPDKANLGSQAQHRFESWNLGSGDELSVNVSTGNLVVSHPVLDLPIRGSSVSLGLTYNSQDPGAIGEGPGWRLDVQRRLTLNADSTVTFIDADGARYTFTNPVTVGTVTTYTRPAALFATLVKDTAIPANEFVLTYKDLAKDKFDILGTEAILVRAEDRFANGVTLAYLGGTSKIDTVTDTAGSRTINLAWDGSNRLASITDWAWINGSGVVQTSATGSRRTYRLSYDANGNLAGWSDPLNTTGSCGANGSHLTCLTYSAGLLTGITKTQTIATLSGSSIAIGTRTPTPTITTTIDYAGTSEVRGIKDAEQTAAGSAANTFARTRGRPGHGGPQGHARHDDPLPRPVGDRHDLRPDRLGLPPVGFDLDRAADDLRRHLPDAARDRHRQLRRPALDPRPDGHDDAMSRPRSAVSSRSSSRSPRRRTAGPSTSTTRTTTSPTRPSASTARRPRRSPRPATAPSRTPVRRARPGSPRSARSRTG